MHLAETKEQARKDVEYGIVPFSRLLHPRAARPARCAATHARGDHRQRRRGRLRGDRHPRRRDRARSSRSSTSRAASARSCCSATTGRDPAATKRSFELFAQYVMPHFHGPARAPAASCEWVTGQRRRVRRTAPRTRSCKAIADHADEQADELTFPPLDVRAAAGRVHPRARRGDGARNGVSQFARSVAPPCDHGMRWWTSHHPTGRSEPGATHRRSCTTKATPQRGRIVRVV